MKYLVEQGADVKLKATVSIFVSINVHNVNFSLFIFVMQDNETSLFQSATFGRMNIVKLLVEKGVDLNACTVMLKFPLYQLPMCHK